MAYQGNPRYGLQITTSKDDKKSSRTISYINLVGSVTDTDGLNDGQLEQFVSAVVALDTATYVNAFVIAQRELIHGTPEPTKEG